MGHHCRESESFCRVYDSEKTVYIHVAPFPEGVWFSMLSAKHVVYKAKLISSNILPYGTNICCHKGECFSLEQLISMGGIINIGF